MLIITVARKPLAEGTVAGNVLRYGAGGINIDGCRIGTTVETWPASRAYAPGQKQPGGVGCVTVATGPVPRGRFPANLVLCHSPSCKRERGGDKDIWVCTEGCPVKALDEQSGVTTNTSHHSYKRDGGDFIGGIPSKPELDTWKTETGTASRFFKQVQETPD